VPGAQAQLQPAAGEQVGGGHLPGQQRRIPERHVEHQRADPEPVGGVRGGDQDRERCGRPEMIDREDRVIAQPLRQPAPVEKRRPPRDAEHIARKPKVARASVGRMDKRRHGTITVMPGAVGVSMATSAAGAASRVISVVTRSARRSAPDATRAIMSGYAWAGMPWLPMTCSS
jgi:hypothetical protein